MTTKLPSKKFWNDAKVMTKHWEDTIRADERKKCLSEMAVIHEYEKKEARASERKENYLEFRKLEENIRADERRKIEREKDICSQCKHSMKSHEIMHYDCVECLKKEAYANATFACEQKCASKCQEAFRRGQANVDHWNWHLGNQARKALRTCMHKRNWRAR
jgi:hypothetical protein